MSSPAFWKVLEKFFHLFKNRVQIPYTISTLQQEITALHLSRKDKLKLQASSMFLLIITIYWFVCLCWCFQQRNTDSQLSTEQILLLLMSFVISACFISVHLVMSFRTEVIPMILNTISILERRIRGKLFKFQLIISDNR